MNSRVNRPPYSVRAISSILKIFFKLLYHQLAWTYDGVAWIVSLGKWNHWLSCLIPYVTGRNVLEIGHGPGYLLSALFKAGVNPYGLDESFQMSRLAQRRLRALGYQPRLVRAIAHRTPFPSAHFDQILATFPSEYIFHPDVLTEFSRLLAPGGQAIIMPLAWITGEGIPDRLAAWLFHATGQAPDLRNRMSNSQIDQVFQGSGLKARVEYLELPTSVLMLIFADKPKPQSLDT